MNDPFASIEDEAPQSPAELRASLLGDARRGYAMVRKIFVQQARESGSRPSVLGEMVQARQETALRLMLLMLALEPLDGLTLPPARWAALLSAEAKPCTSDQLSRAVRQLESRHLIVRKGTSRLPGFVPLQEDGSGAAYSRPNSVSSKGGKGFFIVPDEFWSSGLVDRLRLPGVAMFLICLHDTHQRPAFQVTLEKMPAWYGISERTAERGYHELANHGILLTHPQTVPDRKAPNGIRTVLWRALSEPYSKESRESLQTKTRQRVQQLSGTSGATSESIPVPGFTVDAEDRNE
ncbi:MAG: hypothetical protein QM711_14920 [Micropruina sp.]|uniref:hypothetical protein n=1 Tax=Micropruina sp. TaxID=2737536 RepID=UPI0039E3C667